MTRNADRAVYALICLLGAVVLFSIFFTYHEKRGNCARVKAALIAFTQGLASEAKADPKDPRTDAEINLLTNGFINAYIKPINCG